MANTRRPNRPENLPETSSGKASRRTTQPQKSKTALSPAKVVQELARVDKALVELIVRRCDLVEQMPSEDPLCTLHVALHVLESSVAKAKLSEPKVKEAVLASMRQVVGQTLATRRDLKTAYLGPRHSYSHLAALKYFGDTGSLVPVASISSVFESIIRHDCQTGVVPIENSTDGRVVDTLGMFLKHQVRICGEVLLPIHHNLLSRTPREEITEVYSKPQALSQCRSWLAHNLPTAKLIEMSSTAAAAQLAAERYGAAAVASLEAGIHHGLDVVAASIEDNRNNVTRFVILGNLPTTPTGNDKTALLFKVSHEPGALADVMMLFKKASLNLTWIESFPLPGSSNEYLFFIELEGHQQDANVQDALKKLDSRAERLEILGSYPKGTSL